MDQFDIAQKCANVLSKKFGGVPDDYLSHESADTLEILSVDEILDLYPEIKANNNAHRNYCDDVCDDILS